MNSVHIPSCPTTDTAEEIIPLCGTHKRADTTMTVRPDTNGQWRIETSRASTGKSTHAFQTIVTVHRDEMVRITQQFLGQ